MEEVPQEVRLCDGQLLHHEDELRRTVVEVVPRGEAFAALRVDRSIKLALSGVALDELQSEEK